MEVSLPPEFVAYIDGRVSRGDFESREEAVLAGVARLREDDEAERERLRAMIQEGIDAADRGELLDGEEVMRELRDRFAAEADREAA